MSGGISISMAGWTGAEVTFLPTGIAAAETYDIDTELGGDAYTVYEVLADIERWSADAARGWSGSMELASSFVYDTYAPRMGAKLQTVPSIATAVWQANGTMATQMGWSSGLIVGSATMNPTGSSVGTLDPEWGVRHWAQSIRHPGPAGQVGGYLPSSAAYSNRHPSVSSVMDQEEAAYLTEDLAVAASPRRAHIHQLSTDTWLEMSIGHPDRSRTTELYTVVMPAVG